MGTRTFDYTDPNGTATDSPTRGAVRAHLWQRETVGDRVRTIRQFDIILVDTRLDVDGNPIPADDTTTEVASSGGWASAVLSDTGPNQCWVLREMGPISGHKTMYKKIAGDGPITDAEDVDPTTFQPLDPTPPSVQQILQAMIVGGEVDGDVLKLEQASGDFIDAGNVRGPQGNQGIQGIPGTPGSDAAVTSTNVNAALIADGPAKSTLNATYVIVALAPDAITYNPDGTVASSTDHGVTTTYTYNSDSTVHTETKLGKVKTWAYDGNGNPTGSAVV